MFYAILTLILISAILLILVVLVQNSKGGGLASNFTPSNQILGARQTADFLEKMTWGLAVAIIVLSIVANIFISGGSNEVKESEVQQMMDNGSVPTSNTPQQPAPGAQPAAQPAQPATPPAK
ncbi:MAG: preprotein translocase subunit SecG [Bacteroidia bacterium]|nr:preprotein translocase subunit SecG [Bacteroidia bacterium]